MKQYLSLVREVLDNGVEKTDRTGTGTISIFGAQRKYDLREGFPLLTTKKVLMTGVLRELLWFLRGSTNINDDLAEHTPIWNAWADENGDLGPIYGYQWRKWEKFEAVGNSDDGSGERGLGGEVGESQKDDVGLERKITVGAERNFAVDSERKTVRKHLNEGRAPGRLYRKTHIDQIQNAIDMIKNNPDSRRIIVSAWNVADIDKMRLPPCHAFFQFNVMGDRLDLQLYQRSADVGLGVPFNIASYAILLTMVAKECGLVPGIFVHTTGDTHIYLNHVEKLREQLEREPKKLPELKVADKPFWDLKFEDFEVVGYEHHPFIKLPIAV